MAARAGGLIPMLGSGSNATTVESIDDYVRQLQRNILTPLRDLQPNSITSVLLVIATFDPPVQSKGTDYVLRIRGVDPTLNCGEITACTIFRKNKETMPKIRSAGDIILLDSVKSSFFASRCQLMSNFSTRWDILYTDDSLERLSPIFGYLRRWWASGGPLISPAPLKPLQGTHASDCAEAALGSPQSTVSGTASKTLKQVFQLEEGMQCDLFLEVLYIEKVVPPYEGRPNNSVLKCLLTDYSENPRLHEVHQPRTYPTVDGKRLLWCYIVEPEKIYEFPQLQVNKIYRFRGCMVTKDPLAGMRITVVRDRFYSDRKVVYSVLDSHQGLRPLLKRRAKCIQQQQQQQQLEQQLPLPPTERGSVDYTNSGLAIEDVDTGPVGDTSANSAEIASAEPVKSAVSLWGALATPISLILGSQEINLRYRIQAKVLSVYPKELGQTFVAVCKRCQKQLPPTEGEQQQQCPGCTSTATGHRECRFIMEVADQSASCLVVCRGSEAARLLGQENGKAAQSTSGALCRFWDPATTAAATIGDEQVVDLCVASMLLPGPGPNAGSLVRCLMVVDAVL